MPANNANQELIQALKSKDHVLLKKSLNNGANFEMPIKLDVPVLPNAGRIICCMVSPVIYAASQGDLKSVNLIDECLKNKYLTKGLARRVLDVFWGSKENDASNLKAYQRNFIPAQLDRSNKCSFVLAAVLGGNVEILDNFINSFNSTAPFDFKFCLQMSGFYVCVNTAVDKENAEYLLNPMNLAAALGDKKMVEYLLSHRVWAYNLGVMLDHPNAYTVSALQSAVIKNNLTLVKYLLRFDSGINRTTFRNHTALMLAVRNNAIEIVDNLVQAGANTDKTTNSNHNYIDTAHGLKDFSPLDIAICRNYMDCLKVLLKSKVSSSSYSSALEICAVTGNQEAAKLILKHANNSIGKGEINSTSAFNLAIAQGFHSPFKNIAELLIKESFPFPFAKSKSLTAFETAIKTRNLELLNWLYSNTMVFEYSGGDKIKLDPKDKEFYHKTCDKIRFQHALEDGELDEIKSLLNNFDRKVYCDIDTPFHNGNSSIHLACMHQHFHLVQYLLSKGADFNAINDDGETPLILSIQKGRNSELIVKSLLNHNANLSNQDMKNKTAIMHAAEKGQDNVFDIIVQSPECNINLASTDEQGNTLFLLAVASGSTHCTTKVMELGANLCDKNKNGEDALVLAARSSKEMVLPKYLIANGIAIDGKNKSGKTAFQFSLEQENLSLCTTLIAARLLFLMANQQINISSNSELDFLCAEGAHARQRDKLGRSLYQVAMLKGNLQLAEYLANMNEFVYDEQELTEQQSQQNYKYDFQDIHNSAEELLRLARAQQEESLANQLISIANRALSNEPALEQVAPAITHSYEAATSNTTSRTNRAGRGRGRGRKRSRGRGRR